MTTPPNGINLFEMDLYTLQSFIRYCLLSRHKYGHGIHSPFIFNVVSNIFRNKTDPAIVCRIENIRKRLIADNRVIEVCDRGAGSVKMKSRFRKVSDIAGVSAIPRKYGVLLSNLSHAFGGSFILEFGTSLGISTMYLAAGNCDAKVVSMEGCCNTSEIARDCFSREDFTNIQILNGDFDELLPSVRDLNAPPGLVFIDGNHRHDPLLRYFNFTAEISDEKTVIVIDDIHTSREMNDAWKIIREDPRITASIDIFRMGILFFRTGITPGSYEVRY